MQATDFLTIDLNPVTKKNSQQIIKVKGRPRLIQSKKYRDYEREAIPLIKKQWNAEPIDEPVNVCATFYRKTKHRVDLVNLQECLLDVLVRAGVLADDCSQIVVSMDGSRVMYDSERPRTEVVISEKRMDQTT